MLIASLDTLLPRRWGNVSRKKGLAVICVIALCFSLSACAAGPNLGDGGVNIDRTTARKSGVNTYRYQRNDGDNNISRQNPHLRIGDVSRSKNVESRRMEQAAESISGVASAKAVIAGGRATVRLNIAPGMDRSQVQVIEQEVLRQLVALMPRYEFRVTAR